MTYVGWNGVEWEDGRSRRDHGTKWLRIHNQVYFWHMTMQWSDNYARVHEIGWLTRTMFIASRCYYIIAVYFTYNVPSVLYTLSLRCFLFPHHYFTLYGPASNNNKRTVTHAEMSESHQSKVTICVEDFESKFGCPPVSHSKKTV